MSPNAAWRRVRQEASPSTVLLAAILVANLTLPLIHFWPAEGSGEGGEKRKAMPAPTGRALTIEPIEVPDMARRPLPPVSGAAASGAAAADPPPAEVVCLAWGPFAEAAEAESLAARLGPAPEDFEVLQRQVDARPDYLVTVQTPGSRRAAVRIMNELKRQQVDSYVLDRPGNVLAAGFFGNPAGAESRRRRLAELGYDAAVEPLERREQVYYLLARMAAEVADEADEADEEIKAEAPVAGTCRDIAPRHQFL